MRAARRQALLDLGIGDRRFGWPLEMVRAGAAGRVADLGGRRAVRARGSDVRRSPERCAARRAPCATCPRRCDDGAHGRRHREGAGRRAGSRPASAPRSTSGPRPLLAEASLQDTLEQVSRLDARAPRHRARRRTGPMARRGLRDRHPARRRPRRTPRPRLRRVRRPDRPRRHGHTAARRRRPRTGIRGPRRRRGRGRSALPTTAATGCSGSRSRTGARCSACR